MRKKKTGALEAEVEQLAQQLAEVCAVQENNLTHLQAAEGAVAAKKDGESEVIVQIQELEKLSGSYNQTLFARNAKVTDLKVQLAAAQNSVADAEYDRDRA